MVRKKLDRNSKILIVSSLVVIILALIAVSIKYVTLVLENREIDERIKEYNSRINVIENDKVMSSDSSNLDDSTNHQIKILNKNEEFYLYQHFEKDNENIKCAEVKINSAEFFPTFEKSDIKLNETNNELPFLDFEHMNKVLQGDRDKNINNLPFVKVNLDFSLIKLLDNISPTISDFEIAQTNERGEIEILALPFYYSESAKDPKIKNNKKITI